MSRAIIDASNKNYDLMKILYMRERQSLEGFMSDNIDLIGTTYSFEGPASADLEKVNKGGSLRRTS